MSRISSSEIENGHLMAEGIAEIEQSTGMTNGYGESRRIVAAAAHVES